MPTIRHLSEDIKNYGDKHKHIYAAASMVFFWMIFDGIFSFLFPIFVTEKVGSESLMGLIYGFAAFSGLCFDFLLCRIIRNPNFRKLYLLSFAALSLFPIILWHAGAVWIFLLAMAIWGLYYDLYNFGNFDFISRTLPAEEHSSGFGVMRVFSGLGYMVGPFIAGLLIEKSGSLSGEPFFAASIFLIIAFIFYLFLLRETKNIKEYQPEITCLKLNGFGREFKLWKAIGKIILPVLCLTISLNVLDSVFWTIGPLLSKTSANIDGLGGLFMTAFLVPPLIVGWFVGNLTKSFGKKRTAFLALFSGSIIMICFFFITDPIGLIILAFFVSLFTSLALPSINGAYADYIVESPHLEKEIETLQDSFANLGYMIGPIFGGFMGQIIGNGNTLGILGLLGVIVSLILIKITPKEIKIKISDFRRL